VTRVIDRVNSTTINNFLRETIATKVSLLATDSDSAYNDLPHGFLGHGKVDHSKKQYVVGAIHTNTIEDFWSLITRDVIGTYHKVSENICRCTLPEFQFRYNNRHNNDILDEAVKRV